MTKHYIMFILPNTGNPHAGEQALGAVRYQDGGSEREAEQVRQANQEGGHGGVPVQRICKGRCEQAISHDKEGKDMTTLSKQCCMKVTCAHCEIMAYCMTSRGK